jgi:hypothetical protein
MIGRALAVAVALVLAGSAPALADPPDVVCAGCDWPMPAPADGVPVCSDCDDS